MQKLRLITAALLLLAMVVTLGTALAQTSANYNLEWHVIGGGGQPVDSFSYIVNSTVGQEAASPPYSLSPGYVVSGGYWFGDGLKIPRAYLPLVLKNYP